MKQTITIVLFSFILMSPFAFQKVYAADSVAKVFDIDGNGEVKPLSDGLLTLRYLFGFRGDSLINKAIGNGATRTSSAQIEVYLSTHLNELDIDGNGQKEPLSDGLLLLRYLFGFRADALIGQAIGSGAMRLTANDIVAYLERQQLLVPITIKSKDLIETTEQYYPILTNVPENAVIEWFVDNISAPSLRGSKFNVAGNHVVNAKVYVAGVLLAELDKRILVTRNLEKGSLVPKNNALSSYYQEDNNNDKMAGFQLDIPAGALETEKTITIEEASLSDKFPNLFAVSLKPHGLTFTKSVKVTMPYDQSYRDEPLQIIRYSDNGETTILPILSRDDTNHLVTFVTDHFSTYSVTKGFWGADGNDFESIKKRINWQGTKTELEEILDFKLHGNAVNTTVFDYYLSDKQNKSINIDNPYESYTQFFPEQGVNPIWSDVKNSLKTISIITSTEPTLLGILASAVSYHTDKPVPGDVTDITSWAKTGAKVGFNSYNPINFGESILNFGNEIFWKYQLSQYFQKRPLCVLNENKLPPCQIYDTDVDEPTLAGFYKGYTDNLNGFADIKKMTFAEKNNFWKNAEILYQRYLLGKSNNDKLKGLVLAVKKHLLFLKNANNPSAVTYVKFEALQEGDLYQSTINKPMYRGLPTTLKVGFNSTGLSNAIEVSLARYTGTVLGSNNIFKDHYESIQIQKNCGVSNNCSFTFSPDNIGENLQYRIVSFFANSNIDRVIHNFTLSVVEQYEISSIEIDSINKLGIENGVNQYSLDFNPIILDASNEPVNLLEGYDCKIVLDKVKRITKPCNAMNLKLSEDFILRRVYRDERLLFIFNENSQSYDFKSARLSGDSSNVLINKGDVYVDVDLVSIADQIKAQSVLDATETPVISVKKINGIATASTNFALNIGDTVEYEITGGKIITLADFDGNGRFSSQLSSLNLQELSQNIRYVQTFHRAGTFRPAFRYNDIDSKTTVSLEGSILVNEQNPDLALEVTSSYKINVDKVKLSVIANKNVETIEWTQIRGIDVNLQPHNHSASPSFDIPVLQGEKVKFSFIVEVTTIEGKRTRQLVSFELDLLTTILTPSQPQNIQAIAGDKQVALSWDLVENATGYDICMATEVITDSANCLSHQNGVVFADKISPTLITSLVNDTEYFFVVMGKNASGVGEASAVISVMPKNIRYIKISSTGVELPDSATQWSCVKDKETGLIWESKTDDEGLHNKDNSYTWYDPNVMSINGGGGTENGDNDTDSFVKNVNATNLCGFNNWQLPTVDELKSLIIVDVFSGQQPLYDSHYFPLTHAPNSSSSSADGYWSSNFYSSGASGIHFITGGEWGHGTTFQEYIRLVRHDFSTGKLNDTGVTKCANQSENNLDCPVSTHPNQDAQYGRDATHNDNSDGHAGFSFTKISSTGAELASSASEWSCIKDNVTGLMWEVKTDDGGLHDKNNTYTWYNPNNTVNGGHAGTENGDNDTDSFVSNTNSADLCGAHSWRLPTREELGSIVDRSKLDPSIDTGYFPNTVSNWFWSSSPYAVNSSNVWIFHFTPGDEGPRHKSLHGYVRLVRSGQ